MSVENFKEFVKNLNAEMNAVNRKYPNAEDNNCGSCLEKLNIFTRYTETLADNCQNLHGKVHTESMPSGSICTGANTKIRDDLNVVRNCLENRIQMEEQAIETLLEGRNGAKRISN